MTVGSRVVFARAFLKTIHAYTGWYPFARGKVTDIEEICKGCTLATVAWDDGTTSRANVKALILETSRHLEAA